MACPSGEDSMPETTRGIDLVPVLGHDPSCSGDIRICHHHCPLHSMALVVYDHFQSVPGLPASKDGCGLL